MDRFLISVSKRSTEKYSGGLGERWRGKGKLSDLDSRSVAKITWDAEEENWREEQGGGVVRKNDEK